jgi:hypothetical protein
MVAAVVKLLHLSALQTMLSGPCDLAAVGWAHWLGRGLGSGQMALASCGNSVRHVRRRGVAAEVELDMNLHMFVLVLHMLLLLLEEDQNEASSVIDSDCRSWDRILSEKGRELRDKASGGWKDGRHCLSS